jgi:hypothetical protein
MCQQTEKRISTGRVKILRNTIVHLRPQSYCDVLHDQLAFRNYQLNCHLPGLMRRGVPRNSPLPQIPLLENVVGIERIAVHEPIEQVHRLPSQTVIRERVCVHPQHEPYEFFTTTI